MQVRICPKCGVQNPISRFSCVNCGADISMEPFAEQKEPEIRMYKVCPACSAHVAVKTKADIIKFCPVCHSDAIHRVGEEQVRIDQTEEISGKERDLDNLNVRGEHSEIHSYESQNQRTLENASFSSEISEKTDDKNADLKDDNSWKKRGIQLRNRNDGMCVFVGNGRHMLGAYGDCEPDYFWNLQYVSSEHLVIKVTGDKILVMDNNSKNHSWINQERLQPYMETELMEGDVLKLADQYFEVELCK